VEATATPQSQTAPPPRLRERYEQEVLPAYAERARWLEIMRASIAMSQWRFSSDRQVEDYVAKMYTVRGVADWAGTAG